MHKHHFGFLVAGTFLITAVAGEAALHRATDGSYFLTDPYLKWDEDLLQCACQNLSMVTIGSGEKYIGLKDLLFYGPFKNNTEAVCIGAHYRDFTVQDQYYWAAIRKEFDYRYWWPKPKDINDDCDKQCVCVKNYSFYCVRTNCDSTDIGCLCEEGPNLLENIKVKNIGVILQALKTQLEDAIRTIDNLFGQLAKLKIAQLE